jgi:hypothetical protein
MASLSKHKSPLKVQVQKFKKEGITNSGSLAMLFVGCPQPTFPQYSVYWEYFKILPLKNMNIVVPPAGHLNS